MGRMSLSTRSTRVEFQFFVVSEKGGTNGVPMLVCFHSQMIERGSAVHMVGTQGMHRKRAMGHRKMASVRLSSQVGHVFCRCLSSGKLLQNYMEKQHV